MRKKKMKTNAIIENQAADTRQRIIAAALQLFSQVGYTQATTHLIAETAGVNEVTLFRHFGSKKNLLLACMQAFNAAGFAASIEDGLTGDYPTDLHCLADRQASDTLARLDALRLILCDSRTVPELREAVMTGARSNLVLLSSYFQRQIQAGAIRPDLDPQVLAFAFDSLFSTNLLFESMFQQPLTEGLSITARLHPLVDLFVRATQVDLS
jgi:AcrR family transcriptional regulator